MAGLRKVLNLLITILLSIVVGILSSFVYLFNLIQFGPRRWISVKKRNRRPDILDNEKYGQHHWVALKRCRVRLHYVAQGPDDRPLMLFLHGFPEFWYSWRHQLKEFGKDYKAVAVDMRGYGDSDKPSGISEYTLNRLGEDVRELIDILGYEKCVLVGHDWGGAVAFYFATKYPNKVQSLIVCNSGHPLALRKYMMSTFSQIIKSWYMFLFLAPILPVLTLRADDLRMIVNVFCGRSTGAKPGTFTPEDIEAYKYTFAEYSDLVGPINYYRAALLQSDAVWPKTRLGVRTLMVWGTRDGFLEKKLADLSGQYVDQYSVKYVEGSSHWVQQEEPQQTNSLIRQFLNDE